MAVICAAYTRDACKVVQTSSRCAFYDTIICTIRNINAIIFDRDARRPRHVAQVIAFHTRLAKERLAGPTPALCTTLDAEISSETIHYIEPSQAVERNLTGNIKAIVIGMRNASLANCFYIGGSSTGNVIDLDTMITLIRNIHVSIGGKGNAPG